MHAYHRPALLSLLTLFLTLTSHPASADKMTKQEQTPAGARQKPAATILADIGQASWIAEGKSRGVRLETSRGVRLVDFTCSRPAGIPSISDHHHDR